MVEIDPHIHQLHKSWKNFERLPVPFLLTPERLHVLDLLTHLVANTSESILFCGSEGVGKTTLLEVLEYGKTACAFCRINGHRDLNLDSIKEHLDRALKPVNSGKNARAFEKISTEPQQKTILIIDDAGALRPGFCSTLLQFVDKNRGISVIFVLTYDQLQLKYRSDPAIEDCHIVELPSLTEKECGDFMQHLASQSSDGIYLNSIPDDMAAEIYQHSHGLPARIIAEYGLLSKKHRENPTQILVLAVAVLTAFALAVQWYYSSERHTSEPKRASGQTAEPDLASTEQPYLNLSIPESEKQFSDRYVQLDDGEELPPLNAPLAIRPLGSLQTIESFSSPAVQPSDNSNPIQGSANQNTAEEAKLSGNKAQAAEAESVEIQQAGNGQGEEGSGWLSAQPGNNFTVQLMVLSKRQSIIDVMKKYPSLAKDFRFIRRKIKNNEKFVLIYGAFPDAAAANKARQKLPAEFSRSMTRKISAIRSEFIQ